MCVLALVALFCVVFDYVNGHAMMIDPPNRGSLWRFYSGYPANYNDNENFCGGFQVQHELNGGKCGVCGDNFANPRPRANENTGLYGRGLVVSQYQAGEVVDVVIQITANHMGYFQYSLCVLEDENSVEVGEECFVPLGLENGSERHNLEGSEKVVVNRIKLPEGVRCSRCVLRWHYWTGNFWGLCEEGRYGAMGCGNQETYRTCTDISIV